MASNGANGAGVKHSGEVPGIVVPFTASNSGLRASYGVEGIPLSNSNLYISVVPETSLTFEGEFVPDSDDIDSDLHRSVVSETFGTFDGEYAPGSASHLLLSKVPESPNILYGMAVPDSDDESTAIAPVGINPKRDGWWRLPCRRSLCCCP
ncbi:uncharacterized protein LOC127266619 [Andrographis paniculata]|uniref:uncharacterized protein LOC127266619 n=1 Tax=Andrographis paniculata TaxID=175694 RepID=UPI0021E903F3|nr:uncharacterized protein LOC127266619 [Andrographis paniculata]